MPNGNQWPQEMKECSIYLLRRGSCTIYFTWQSWTNIICPPSNGKRSRNFSRKRVSAQPISGQKRRQERVQNWIKLEPKLLFRRQKTELASPHFPRRGADVKIRLESLDSRNPPNWTKTPKTLELNFAHTTNLVNPLRNAHDERIGK